MTTRNSFSGESNTDRLITRSQQGDRNALSELLVIYSPLVHSSAKCFVSSGVELDDLFQEGMIGMIYAVNSYKQGKSASFSTYANVCVRNRLLSVIRKCSGKSVFFDKTVSLEDDSFEISDGESVEEKLIIKDECDKVFEYINSKLSQKERRTLRLFLSGLSYEEISHMTGSSPKSVGNALQRVRQKLKKYNS